MVFGTQTHHKSIKAPANAPEIQNPHRAAQKSTDHMLIGLVASQLIATALLLMVALLTLDIVQGWAHPVVMAGIGLALIGLLIAGGYVLGCRFGHKIRPKVSAKTSKILDLETEVTQLRRRLIVAEREAKSAGQAKQAFVSQLNHNIRTPLNHILGFAQLIRHETFGSVGDSRYLTYLDDISKSGEVLMKSFGQILELAEFNSGTHQLNYSEIKVEELERSIRNEYEMRAQNCGVDIQFGFSEADVFQADKHCVQRVLSQLASNALTFTPRGGNISIDAYCVQDSMIFCIADTGIGISPEQLSLLQMPLAFENFEQSSRTDGKGMGLAMARTLAELCGGELRIDSTVGVGTTAVVSFPISPIAPFDEAPECTSHSMANSKVA